MADQIEAELVVTAIAKGFGEMSNAILEQAKAFKDEEAATRKANQAIKEQETAARKLEHQQRMNQQASKDWAEASKMAFEIIGKGLDYAAAASERLGRTEMPEALDDAERAVQRLGDSLLELPIGKVNLLFQVFGDEALKDADAIEVLTRGLQGAADGANTLTAVWIKFQAETGQISWEDAAAQINSLTESVEEQGVFVDATAARWAGLAESMKPNPNIAKWLEMREAEVGAANLAMMAQVAQTLAAGLGGEVGAAQQTYNDTIADSNLRIAEAQEKIAGLNKWSRDYKTTLAELNGVVAEQTARQLDAAAALELANKQFVFQQAAASLDEQGQLSLAFTMGLIDEASYNASLKVIGLTETFDANNDGIVSLNENQAQYIEALNYAASIMDGTTAPAVQNLTGSLQEAEEAMGGTVVVAKKLNDEIGALPTDKTITIDTVYTTTGTPPPYSANVSTPSTAQAYAAGGDFVVPPGYPNDSYAMRVQSGERVIVQTPGQQMAQQVTQAGMGLSIGNVTINAAPGQDGAALWAELKAAAGYEVRAQRNTGF